VSQLLGQGRVLVAINEDYCDDARYTDNLYAGDGMRLGPLGLGRGRMMTGKDEES
jgi:hypothetical protein